MISVKELLFALEYAKKQVSVFAIKDKKESEFWENAVIIIEGKLKEKIKESINE